MRAGRFALGTLVALGVLGGGGAGAPLQAQMDEMAHFRNHHHVGFGYVVSAPTMFVGFNGLVLRASGFGLYADVKLSTDSPGRDQSCCPYSVEEAEAFGDLHFQDKSAWRSFNVALARVIGPQLAVYAGGGMTRERAYREYVDVDGGRGAYWVEEAESWDSRLNVLAGLLFHASRNLVFVVGGEMTPPGFTIGLTLALPR